MELFQSWQVIPWHNSTAQVNKPLSTLVTFKITRVNFWKGIQLKLYLWSKGLTNPASPDDRTLPTSDSLKSTDNLSKDNPDEKLKFQLSGNSVTPSRSWTVFNWWSTLWSESVSSGGGSYHVTLTPSEIKISVVYFALHKLPWLQTENYKLQMVGRTRGRGTL